MNRNHPRDVLRDLCAHVHEDDGLDPRLDKKTSRRRTEGPSRKDHQLCKQTLRVLSHALRSRASHPLLMNLEVAAVTPAPDATRLEVLVQALTPIDDAGAREVLRVLRSLRGTLRAELAASVSRKRVPELIFAVRPYQGVPDELT